MEKDRSSIAFLFYLIPFCVLIFFGTKIHPVIAFIIALFPLNILRYRSTDKRMIGLAIGLTINIFSLAVFTSVGAYNAEIGIYGYFIFLLSILYLRVVGILSLCQKQEQEQGLLKKKQELTVLKTDYQIFQTDLIQYRTRLRGVSREIDREIDEQRINLIDKQNELIKRAAVHGIRPVYDKDGWLTG